MQSSVVLPPARASSLYLTFPFCTTLIHIFKPAPCSPCKLSCTSITSPRMNSFRLSKLHLCAASTASVFLPRLFVHAFSVLIISLSCVRPCFLSFLSLQFPSCISFSSFGVINLQYFSFCNSILISNYPLYEQVIM